MLIHRSIRRVLLASAVLFLAASAGTTAVAAAAVPTVVQDVNGSGQGTVIRGVTASAGTPLLARFQYDFTNGDHPLRRLAAAALPWQSAVEATMADKNGDDTFTYRVTSKAVDPTGIQSGSFHGTCRGTCAVFLPGRPAGDNVFVLTGFRFSFDIAEHPVDKIAVSESNGVLRTSFQDQNGDDPYTYDVTYAWVPRSRLGVLGEVADRVHGSGTASRFAPGDKVIRGFSLDNTATGDASDNNVRDIGVVASQSTIDVFYGDRNPGDSADWDFRVQYAPLV